MSVSADQKMSRLADREKASERQIHYSPHPGTCGICSKDLLEEKFCIDGAMKPSGIWGNMCPECFLEHGAGIEWGVGQLYMQETKGSWLLVAGFSPDKDSACAHCGEEVDKKDMIKLDSGEWMCLICIETGQEMFRQMREQKKSEGSDDNKKNT
jgi:hypothetical protein